MGRKGRKRLSGGRKRIIKLKWTARTIMEGEAERQKVVKEGKKKKEATEEEIKKEEEKEISKKIKEVEQKIEERERKRDEAKDFSVVDV